MLIEPRPIAIDIAVTQQIGICEDLNFGAGCECPRRRGRALIGGDVDLKRQRRIAKRPAHHDAAERRPRLAVDNDRDDLDTHVGYRARAENVAGMNDG